MRVLHRDRFLPREVIVFAAAQDGRDVLGSEDAVPPVEHHALRAPQRRDRAALVVDDVRAAVADDLVALARERTERDLVRHRPGGRPDGRFLAEQGGDPFLEAVDGRVVAEDVVADLRVVHGLAHAGAGLGDGIAPQIDDFGHDGDA